MSGLAAVDLGINSRSVEIDNLDTLQNLLSVTNQKRNSFLLTEKGEPVMMITPLVKGNSMEHTTTLLDEYEKELDSIL